MKIRIYKREKKVLVKKIINFIIGYTLLYWQIGSENLNTKIIIKNLPLMNL